MKFTVAAVALLLSGIGLIVFSNFIVYMIVGEINVHTRSEDQFSAFFVQSRMGKILEPHRELYPESARRRQIYIVGVAGILLLFAAFIVFIAPSFI